MAKRYFNIFKSHIVIIAILIALICLSEVTEGTVSMIAKVLTGILLIWAAITYAIWLIKAPTANIPEENL